MFERRKAAPRKIDPRALTAEDACLLNNYWNLREQAKDPALYLQKTQGPYVVPSVGSFTVDRDIAFVIRSNPYKKEKFRVLGQNEIGRGSFGSVIPVVASGTRSSKGKVTNKTNFNAKKWVAKIESSENAERESRILQKTRHLAATEPTPFGHGSSIFFMRRAKGINLRQWLENQKQQFPLSPMRAAYLWNAIIKAYIEQIYNPGVIHGDITPSNIMIDATNPRSPIITFIDVGLGHIKGDAINDKLCAVSIMAPEVAQYGHKSTASDIYAFGRLIERNFPQLQRIQFFVNRMQADNHRKRPDINTVAITFKQLLNDEPAPASENEQAFAKNLFLRIESLNNKTGWFDKIKIGKYYLQTNTVKMLVHYFDYEDGIISVQELQKACLRLAKDGLKCSYWSSEYPTKETRLFYQEVVKNIEELTLQHQHVTVKSL